MSELNPSPAPQTPPPHLPPRLPSRAEGVKNTVLTLFGALMFGGFLVAGAIWTLPNLVSDWTVRNQVQPIENSRISKGKCSSRLVFHICDATIQVRAGTRTITRDVNYVFTDFHTGDYSVDVVADPARPELVTTDMALDKLWNRTITLVVGAAVLLAFTVLPLLALVRRFTRRAAA